MMRLCNRNLRNCAAPRDAPELSFPAYSYVTGKFPHPVSDPGHSFGHPAGLAQRPFSETWRASVEYRFGIDLFNYGYYWEVARGLGSLVACLRPALGGRGFLQVPD